jgi:hypothetical protein
MRDRLAAESTRNRADAVAPSGKKKKREKERKEGKNLNIASRRFDD